MAGVAYFLLTKILIRKHGKDSVLAKAIGNDSKGRLSLAIYAAAIPIAFWSTFVAMLLYVIVAVMWLVPDRRIEKVLRS